MITDSMPSGSFYTYIHTRADDGKVFYVGKGRSGRAITSRGRNAYWHRVAKKHGWDASIVAQWDSEADAFEHEKFLIACFRGMSEPLCNLTEGGEGLAGYKHAAEAKVKFSARINSAEHRLKISIANSGRRHTPEWRAKILAAQTGLKRSAEVRARMSGAQRGKVVSTETRAKISASLMGRPASDATKAKLLLIAQSPERRAKHSAAMKGRPWSEARRAAQKSREIP